MIPQSRALAAVRDGLAVVCAGLGAGFVVTGIASVVYRPRGHVGSPLDWLRIAGYLLAMAVGAPLHVRTGVDHGELRLVPLTITAVLVVVAVRRGRRRGNGVVCALTAALVVGLVSLAAGSRLTSYGHGLRLHYSAPALTAAIGAAAVVGLSYALAGRARGGGWARATAGALRGAAVVAAVAALTAVGVSAWKFPASTLGAAPGLLGDGAAWLGGFALGGRLDADLSSPIPFLSGNLGIGLITGGAWPWAYALVVVPFAAAVAAGRRQQRDAPPEVRPWAEFGRAVVVNAMLWFGLSVASRLRFSGRLGADVLSGSAGLDVWSTVFVAALWGGVSAIAGLAPEPGIRCRWWCSSR
ncbi:MAG: hypothetical protein QOI76_2425 [Frankiales bacterium]|nr:hypothetical protein [Frankiales bacterium]